MIKEVNEIIL